jgi:hypothetical protein
MPLWITARLLDRAIWIEHQLMQPLIRSKTTVAKFPYLVRHITHQKYIL